jgi:uncharacterized protein with ParB-like and HNH nuclease domain
MQEIGLTDQKKSSIGSLFIENTYYEVPIFQREYSWRKDEWVDLSDDIEKALVNDVQHFFGFMMLKEQKASKPISIIEGQQRFATICIIICVVRDLLSNLDDSKCTEIQKTYVKTFDIFEKDSTEKYKLTLSKTNKDFFQEYVQDKDLPLKKLEKYSRQRNIHPSNKLIIDCYKHFYGILSSRIEKLDKEGKIGYLLKYLKIVMTNFIVLVTGVTNNKTAYNVFQTLNDRGLDLALADLLKVHLFETAGEDEVDSAKSEWEEMTSNLGAINLNVFLKHFWLSKYDVINEKYLMDEFEKKIKTKQNVFKFLKDLKGEAEVYETLYNKREDYWQKETAQLLDELFNLSRDMVLPVLLSASQNLTENSFKTFIEKITAVIFRYLTIGEKESKELISVLSKIAIDIRNGKLSNLPSIEDKLKALYVDDETFRTNFFTKDIKTVKVARYILEKIEKSMNPIKEFSAKITLEHVLPKNPDKDWIRYLRENRYDLESMVNKIGNMTLLLGKVNKKACNKFFTIKRDEFYSKMTTLKINKDLARISSWSPDDIQKRQEFLASKAIKVWEL